MTRTRTSLIALAAALAAMPAATAAAQDAPGPKPTPDCNAIHFLDPTGDAVAAYPVGNPSLITGEEGSPNSDLVSGFFTYRDEEVRANIQVADLSKTVPGNASTLELYYRWTDDSGAIRFVAALIARDGSVVFEHGTQDGNLLTTEGTTAGELHEGPNGIASIVVPGSRASEGSTLNGAYASTVLGYDLVAVRSLPEADDSEPKNQTIAKCAAAPAVGQPAVPSAGDPPAPGATKPTVRVRPGTVSARKAKKSITFTLRSSDALANVSLKLARGSKTYATGRTAKIASSGKVKVKVRGKLKPGTYKLTVAGTDSAGTRHTLAYRVKVKK